LRQTLIGCSDDELLDEDGNSVTMVGQLIMAKVTSHYSIWLATVPLTDYGHYRLEAYRVEQDDIAMLFGSSGDALSLN
jgi:hypothetical protein